MSFDEVLTAAVREAVRAEVEPLRLEIERLRRDAERPMTVAEAAGRYKMCERSIRRHIKAGRLKATRVGGRLLVHPEDVGQGEASILRVAFNARQR